MIAMWHGTAARGEPRPHFRRSPRSHTLLYQLCLHRSHVFPEEGSIPLPTKPLPKCKQWFYQACIVLVQESSGDCKGYSSHKFPPPTQITQAWSWRFLLGTVIHLVYRFLCVLPSLYELHPNPDCKNSAFVHVPFPTPCTGKSPLYILPRKWSMYP